MSTELHALAGIGCHFVRIANEQKRPLDSGWHRIAVPNSYLAMTWLELGYNIGLLLGPASGVVDVEYDTPAGREQLAAFGILDIPTPTWRSARGEHRLFRWEPWMPATAAMKVDDIEVRLGGKAAQSVLPPSRHPSGEQYQWLVRPTDVAVATFPAQLLAGVACGA